MRSLFLPPLFCRFLVLGICLASTVGAVSTAKWFEVRSPHFTVVSDAGEKQARQIASQFEQIRAVFEDVFPNLRADMGKPVIIYALKNEDSMKALLPSFWEVKGHAHPAGLYIPGEDKHCAVVRTNVQSDNPYEVVYHEYAHALENLNFQGLPLWLAEGVAEFLGNSRINEGFVEIGTPSPRHLAELQSNKLVPIEVLLQVDAKSPYYNEKDRASLFYAESWALVHYLMMDSEARQHQLLKHFLVAYEASGDQVQAAQQSFGDLTRFAHSVEQYSRREKFTVSRVNTSIHVDPKNYPSRVLSAAEVDALRGDLYTRTHRPIEAKAALEEALQEDQNLALAHEGLGLLLLSQQETELAETEFKEAVRLNSNSFLAYYFSARARMRDQMNTPEATREVIADLQKAIELNPQFAPAYEAVSSLYSLSPETADKAIAAGKKAMELEPGTFSFAVNYGYVLLRIGKLAEARTVATKIQAAAKISKDQLAAQQLMDTIRSRETYERQLAARAQEAKDPNAHPPTAPADPPGSSLKESSRDAVALNKHAGEDEFAVEGTISSTECPKGSPGKVILTVNNRSMAFTVPDFGELQVLVKNEDVSSHPPLCSEWNGKHAKLFFYKLKDKKYFGELSTIQFF